MANSKSRKFNMSRPGSDIGVYVTNFLPGNCPPDVVDTTIFQCPTDGGCAWSVVCEKEDMVCIDGVCYRTWQPKGIRDDNCSIIDPGLHFHFSCASDAVGVRVTGQNIVDIFTSSCDPNIISKLCDWLFENCANTQQFIDWVCETILSNCFNNENFVKAMCNWFINSVLNEDEFESGFVSWIINCLFNEPSMIDRLCDKFEECLGSDALEESVCNAVESCLSKKNTKDKICGIVLECLDDSEVKEAICYNINNACVTACSWNSESDSDPTGEAADCWYLIDEISGCVTHIAIDGVWVCIGGQV